MRKLNRKSFDQQTSREQGKAEGVQLKEEQEVAAIELSYLTLNTTTKWAS